MPKIRIGTGAGFADDRIEPAAELAEHGALDYLVFECLAERTIAAAQLERMQNPEGGYNEWLPQRMDAVLKTCVAHGTKIITNMGAANPAAAAGAVAEIARRMGLAGLKIAAVTGDDVLGLLTGSDLPLLDEPGTLRSLPGALVSANAYLGAEPVAEALAWGADIVITGRIADPSLYLAPLMHEFGWAPDDWELMGKGICVGHLLECGAQVTGGYFADPGYKDVEALARLGFPLAEVDEDGAFTVTKVPGSGGQVSVRTCVEQLLYEVHDPAAYLSADAVADFSRVELAEAGHDRVRVTGASGYPRPTHLKVSVGYLDGYLGTGEISYAGPNAVARARLALEVVRERLALAGASGSETRFELIGLDAVHRGAGVRVYEPNEVRIRVAGRSGDEAGARQIGHEVSALWLNGPAGGAGAIRRTEQVVAIASVLIPRDQVTTDITFVEV